MTFSIEEYRQDVVEDLTQAAATCEEAALISRIANRQIDQQQTLVQLRLERLQSQGRLGRGIQVPSPLPV